MILAPISFEWHELIIFQFICAKIRCWKSSAFLCFRLQVLIYFSRCCVCMCVLCVLQSQLTKTSWLNIGPCCSAIAIVWTISFIACCDDRQNVIRFLSRFVQIEVKKSKQKKTTRVSYDAPLTLILLRSVSFMSIFAKLWGLWGRRLRT